MSKHKPKMVDWYNPAQLVNTGIQALVSSTLGRMIDPRTLIGAEGSNSECVFDYSDQDEFSFDYIADTGDGWDSTYTMAYLTTAPTLTIVDGAQELKLNRPNLLILGGDQVYPVASKKEYQQRLSSPFEAAATSVRKHYGSGQPRRDVFLIPGNHDWYDGLSSMSNKYFAYDRETKNTTPKKKTIERKLGQFNTRQKRGYFVIKLPNNWEVWCVDIQLGNDIDPKQRSFFKWHAEDLSSETKVVICSAVPTIVYGSNREHLLQDSLTYGLATIIRAAYDRGAKVMVQIAGDVHNYQHYEFKTQTKTDETYQREHIVCGGGGAFLHPTHGFNIGNKEDPRVEPVARYPDRNESKSLSNQILKFPLTHWGLSLVLASLYVMMFWNGGFGSYRIEDIFNGHNVQVLSIACMLLSILGCSAFGFQKPWWGAIHGISHIIGAGMCWSLARSALSHVEPLHDSTLALLISVLICSTIISGFIVGLYLWVSLNVFRVHHNEAFSAIGSPHYKCMLRCNVETDGSLTIHSLGVKTTDGEQGEHPVKVHLIETISV